LAPVYVPLATGVVADDVEAVLLDVDVNGVYTGASVEDELAKDDDLVSAEL